MRIYKRVYSPIDVNTYIITGDNHGCIIIDCGCYNRREEQDLEELIRSRNLIPVLLLDTHCHLDHVFGNGFMLAKFNLAARCHEDERYNLNNAVAHAAFFGLTMNDPPEPGQWLLDGETIHAAGLDIEVIAVPGHSPGGVSFLCRNEGVIFTGDALFKGSIGRSDLPGGNSQQLLESISGRLFTLDPEIVVYPGHGPETTIGHEVATNPFFI